MIKLTITSEVLKEEIENEIKELEKASDTDDDGKDADWYKDMGFRVPEEIVDPKIRIDRLVDDKSNYRKVEDIMFVKPKLIELIVAGDDKEDTSIFLKSNKTFSVKQSAGEVYAIIMAAKKKKETN
jgi:(2Fe-2S) ferredoxin